MYNEEDHDVKDENIELEDDDESDGSIKEDRLLV